MIEHEKLVDKIYEAALIPEYWPLVLDDLAGMAGGIGTILFASSKTNFRWISSPATERIMGKFIEDGWHTRNTRAARLMNFKHTGFVTDLDVYTREELDQDLVYVQALRPLGVGWGAATAIPVPGGDLLVFSIEREFIRGPVEREKLPGLDAMRPHLARGALLSARLLFERARVVVDSLAVIGLPAAVVTTTARLIAQNELFTAMTPQIRIGARDKVLVTDTSARQIFEAAVETISVSNIGAKSLPLPAVCANPAAVVHIIPLRGSAQDVFIGGSALLLVNRIDSRVMPSLEILQGLFDLSPAEARVARIIMSGCGINGAAAELILSRETVRTHLKAIFSKTGRSNQAALVALMGRIHPLDLN